MVRTVKESRKSLLWALPVVAVLVGGGLFALYVRHQRQLAASQASSVRPENNVDYSPSTPADNATNNDRKSSSTPAPTLDNGPSTTTNASFTVQIVSHSVSSTNLHVGTLVSGVTTGTCTLTAAQQGQPDVTLATASVQQDVNNYDCGAINVATSQFPDAGTWHLTLTVVSESQQTSATADVIVPSGS